MRVIDLTPGIRILEPHNAISHTFVAQTSHPLYPGLQLVIWRMENREWSHDALSPLQDVGDPDPGHADFQMNLRHAFHG